MRVAFVLRSTEVTPALFVLFSAPKEEEKRRVHKSEVANSLELATELYTGFVIKPIGPQSLNGTRRDALKDRSPSRGNAFKGNASKDRRPRMLKESSLQGIAFRGCLLKG